MIYGDDFVNAYRVTWVGDFGVITTTAENCNDEEHAAAFSRQQLIDWHGLDPMAFGFRDCRVEEL